MDVWSGNDGEVDGGAEGAVDEGVGVEEDVERVRRGSDERGEMFLRNVRGGIRVVEEDASQWGNEFEWGRDVGWERQGKRGGCGVLGSVPSFGEQMNEGVISGGFNSGVFVRI